MLAPWQRLAPSMQQLVQALQAWQALAPPQTMPPTLPQTLPQTRPQPRPSAVGGKPEKPQVTDTTQPGFYQRPAFMLSQAPFAGPMGAGGLPSPIAPIQAGVAGSPLVPQLAQSAQAAQAPMMSNLQGFQQALNMIGQMGPTGVGPAPAAPSNQQPGLNNLGLAQILGSAGAAIAEPGTWQSRLGAAGAQTAQTLQQRQDLLAQQARQEQMDKAQLANQNENQNLAKMQLAASLQDKLKPFEQELAETEQLALAKNPWLKVPRGGSAIPVSPMASAMTGGQPILGQPGAESRGAYTLYQGTDGQVYSADQLRQMEQAEMPLPAIVGKVGTARADSGDKLIKVSEGQGLYNPKTGTWEVPVVPKTGGSSEIAQQRLIDSRGHTYAAELEGMIDDAVKEINDPKLMKQGTKPGFFMPTLGDPTRYRNYIRQINASELEAAVKEGRRPKYRIPTPQEWEQEMKAVMSDMEEQQEQPKKESPSFIKDPKRWLKDRGLY